MHLPVMINNGSCCFKTIACTSGSFTSSKSIPPRCHVSPHHYNTSSVKQTERLRSQFRRNHNTSPSSSTHARFTSICHLFLRSRSPRTHCPIGRPQVMLSLIVTVAPRSSPMITIQEVSVCTAMTSFICSNSYSCRVPPYTSHRHIRHTRYCVFLLRACYCAL